MRHFLGATWLALLVVVPLIVLLISGEVGDILGLDRASRRRRWARRGGVTLAVLVFFAVVVARFVVIA